MSNPTPISANSLESVADRLSTPQREALSALISGQPIKSAAQAAGVHRATLHRWLSADHFFRAAYHALQQEARESAKVKLLCVAQSALDTVALAVRNGDKRIAYALLKDLGLLTKLKDVTTDPELLRLEIEIEHANRQRALQPPTPQSPPKPLSPSDQPPA